MRARMRLWLRSERAFGLDAMPVVPSRPRPQPVADVHDPDRPAPPALAADSTPATAPESAVSFNTSADSASAASYAGLIELDRHQPFTSQVLSTEERRLRLLSLDRDEVRGCTRCRLCESRTHTVFGEGDPDAKIFFVGEGPGETEDRTGRPFVGRAGEKLNEMIAAMGLTRQQVYIANIVKCRPPQNREPAPDEVATCTPYLVRQLEIVRPQVIVTLGRPALQYMLGQKISISRIRGQWQTWRGIRLMPTFHPAYILRTYTREVRSAVWSDLQQVMNETGLRTLKRAVREEV